MDPMVPGEAAAFFVCPGNDFHGQIGFHPRILKALHHLERGKDSQSPIEPASGRLAVQVASNQERGAFGRTPFMAHEEVGHRILEHTKSARLGIAGQQATRLTILSRKRLAVHASRRCSDAREFVDALEQAH